MTCVSSPISDLLRENLVQEINDERAIMYILGISTSQDKKSSANADLSKSIVIVWEGLKTTILNSATYVNNTTAN